MRKEVNDRLLISASNQ
ncbi:Protein of unknown function [Lactobacillus helveticus CIRM-BIA 101]|nr:Protein of unknown function [Lactobacillus helveticus CIRM-BIA 101]